MKQFLKLHDFESTYKVIFVAGSVELVRVLVQQILKLGQRDEPLGVRLTKLEHNFQFFPAQVVHFQRTAWGRFLLTGWSLFRGIVNLMATFDKLFYFNAIVLLKGHDKLC